MVYLVKMYHLCIKLDQYNKYLVSAEDANGLVFHTKSSAAIVLNMHPCFSSCLWISYYM